MYLVKSLANAVGPVSAGKLVSWTPNQVRLVDDTAVHAYENRAAAFTILAGPDFSAVVAAAADISGGITAEITAAIAAAIAAIPVSRAAVALTDAATVAVNAALSDSFTLALTGGGTRILGAPTNPVDGQVIDIKVTQGTGSDLLTYNAIYLFAGGVAPVLSTANGAIDMLTAKYWGTLNKWFLAANKAWA